MNKNYAETTARIVPGYREFQKMAGLLLNEQATKNAHILVLGAGGGEEISTFGQMFENWHFTGVDPSEDMLALAKEKLASLKPRVQLHHGYIDSVPQEKYDGATAILVFHFLNRDEKLKTLEAIAERLKPGAPFVIMHHSFPQGAEKQKWLDRYIAYSIASGTNPAQAQKATEAFAQHLTILSPEEDEALLHKAGFCAIESIYSAFTFRGWVARKV